MMKKISTSFIFDNSQKRVEVITGLQKGDKLIAKKMAYSSGDIGMSGLTYRYEAFIPGKTYYVHHTFVWDFTKVAYVSDEDNSLHFATPEQFEVV